jgi:hypothetical protein
MIVFTPSSMGEVGDNAKNGYFESWARGLGDARGGVGQDGMVHAAQASQKSLIGCFIRCWPASVTGQLFPPTNHRIVQFRGQELLFRQRG